MIKEQFGFTFELANNDTELAIDMIQNLLQAALTGSDEELSEAVHQMHPRATNKIFQFLELMRKKHAQFKIEREEKRVAFNTPEEIARTARRLSKSNIRYHRYTTAGTITITPAERRFRLTNDQEEASMEGELTLHIRNEEELFHQFNNKLVTAEIRSVQVGKETPKHVLMNVLNEVTNKSPE